MMPIILGALALRYAPETYALSPTLQQERPQNMPHATLAGGCFWCVESEFRTLDGVTYTAVGYTGGEVENPTYQQITTGKTGHAEAVDITYDPDVISYADLVEHFLLNVHDPTEIDRQGVDVGPQYRSVIFYHDEDQKRIAQSIIKRFDEEGHFKKPIATKVQPAAHFWVAEDYHQQYYEKYKEKTGQTHIRLLVKGKI